MCKVVYLTSRRFHSHANDFKIALADELRQRKIEVVTDISYDIFNLFRKHKTYGIAIAFDFFRDRKEGRGLTLNKNCSYISRDFAYNLSNVLDLISPRIKWRDFKFVDSSDRMWFRFFNKVSAETKSIFYLCTHNNPVDFNSYSITKDKIIKSFADEIVRCLRSDYDYHDYQRSVKLAKMKISKVQK